LDSSLVYVIYRDFFDIQLVFDFFDIQVVFDFFDTQVVFDLIEVSTVHMNIPGSV